VSEVENAGRRACREGQLDQFPANHLANVAASASGILQLVALLALVVVGTHQVVDHRLTIGGLIAANMLATRALQPMRQLAAAWHQLQAVGAAFKRIDELMREAVESPPGELAPMPPLTGQISLERVTWRVDDQAPAVLHEADLEIAAGEIIGIVGPSGSGKTTIANLAGPSGRPPARVGRRDRHRPPLAAQLRARSGACRRIFSSSPVRCARTLPWEG
jgi:subfamily B ATP-binding cassette protein HlyB/CyaB